jgi:conjugal transfer pilus assembly protein TraU
VFANPIASMWCAADCVKVTAGADNLSAHFCAGCDGNLYPLTGHVFANDDSVRVSSLLTQRMITKLHRQGMLMQTMGKMRCASEDLVISCQDRNIVCRCYTRTGSRRA